LWTESGGSFRVKQNRRLPPVERGEKNRRLRPTDVSIQSHENVWWQCKVNKQHIWQALVCDRVRYQSGCPFCTNQKVADDNNLAAEYPKLLKLWHPTKNRVEPTSVLPKSNKIVWWLCPDGHEFESSVSGVFEAQEERGCTGCPYCSGRRVSTDDNLAVRFPVIAKLWWHPAKNLPLRPEQVRHGTGKIVWWRCVKSREHEWQATVCSVVQTYKRAGRLCCSQCGRTKTMPGKNG
jgi:hypothetical protein